MGKGSDLLQQLDSFFSVFVHSHYLFNLFSAAPIWLFFWFILFFICYFFFQHVVGVIVLSFHFTNETAAKQLNKVCCMWLDFKSKLTGLKSAHAYLALKITNHYGGHAASIEPEENCRKNQGKTGRSNTSQKERKTERN